MKKFLWIAIALVLVLSGCELFTHNFYQSQDDFPDPTKGALVLLLSEDGLAASKTIKPPDLYVAQYDMVCTHDTIPGTHFEEENWQAASAYTKNGLAPGNWTLTLVAEDSAGFEIGAVNGDPAYQIHFTITAGQVTNAGPVSILPIVGTGGLSLTVSWPAVFLTSPVVRAYLVPPSVANPDAVYMLHQISTPYSGGNSITYTSTGLATGYHSLRIFLLDGPTQKWGFGPEYVRIVNGVQTSGTVGLAGTGNLSLQLIEDLKNPIAIGWSPTPPASITQGNNIAITAVPARAVTGGYEYTYRWYADGGATSVASGASIDDGSALPVGEHSLVVVLTERLIAPPNTIKTLSSGGFSFSVVTP